MLWYDTLSKKIEPFAEILLIGIILVTIMLLVFGEKYSKIIWATYLISP